MSRHPLHSLAVLIFILLGFHVPRALALTAAFDTAADIPVTSSGYTASGSLTLVLNFAPQPGAALTVVKNTAIAPISGTFAGLPQGGTISAIFGGRSYPFVAHYWGGTGNDLVLVWPDTGLAAWGENGAGQLGNGDTADQSLPIEAVTSGALAGKTIVSVASGPLHTLALTAEGSVYSWGDNTYGQLGDGSNIQRLTPVAVNVSGVLAGKTVIAISAGSAHSLALTTEGKIYGWGYNANRQLGEGVIPGDALTTNRNAPVAVNMDANLTGEFVVAISSGGHHNLALTTSGRAWSWGSCNYGQCGVGLSNVNIIHPAGVITTGTGLEGRTVTAISAGRFHSAVLTADNVLYAWGLDNYGQLGDGAGFTDALLPSPVVLTGALSGKSVTAISAGTYHTLSTTSEGQAFAWGLNTDGELGEFVSYSTNRDAPVAVYNSAALDGLLAGRAVISCVGGYTHSMALTSDGLLAAWGGNASGQLGNGTTTNRFSPFRVSRAGFLEGKQIVTLAAMAHANSSTVIFAKAPEIKVEDNGVTPSVELTDGLSTVPLGTVLVGQNVTHSFTILNAGTLPLTGIAVVLDGAHASDIAITQQPDASLAPGASTLLTLRFTPAAAGNRTAALHVISNDADETSFDISINGAGTQSTHVIASFASPTAVPITAYGYTASGLSLAVALGFAPSPGTNLTVVRNTGPAFISGAFSNVPQGGTVYADYGGQTYAFTANYWGGSGNDLVLLWPYNGIAGWGFNSASNPSFANGTSVNSSVPTAVDTTGVTAARTVIAVANNNHKLVLTADGLIYGWGRNANGELGDGTTTLRLNPVPVIQTGVLAGKKVVAVAAGSAHSLALTADGQVFGWGYNTYGNLGDGTNTQRTSPVAVDRTGVLNGKTVVAIAAGYDLGLALTSEGRVVAWGRRGLGDGSSSFRYSPVEVDVSGVLAGKTVVAISAASGQAMALTSDNLIASWGANDSGQLGDGTITLRPSPVLVNQSGALAGRTVVAISAGATHTMALTADGKVFAWGSNGSGELGIGTTVASSVPVATEMTGVLAGKTVTSVSAGWGLSHALTSDGLAWGWGSSPYGQVGDGTSTNRLTPVAVNTAGFLSDKPVSTLAGGEDYFCRLAIYGKPAPPPPPGPEIAIEQPAGVDIINGLNVVPFGGVTIGAAAVKTFTIRNTGTMNLTGLAVTKNGANPAAFIAGAPGLTTVPPGGSTSFTVTFTALAEGDLTALIHIASNDLTENPFDISLTGTGTRPEIVVEQPGGSSLVDGAGTVDFGMAAAASPVVKTFTIRNTGTATLTLSGATKNGPDEADFSVGSPGAATLAPGEQTTLDVTFNPANTGVKSAAIHIASDDADENPFDINLSGTGVNPLIPWAASYGLTGGSTAASAIPANDGLNNLLKFAFNLTPSRPDLRVLTSGTGISGLPLITLDGSSLRFEFIRRKGSALNYTAQKSNTATTWLPLTAAPTVTSIDSAWERVVVLEPLTDPLDSRALGRVLVTQP